MSKVPSCARLLGLGSRLERQKFWLSLFESSYSQFWSKLLWSHGKLADCVLGRFSTGRMPHPQYIFWGITADWGIQYTIDKINLSYLLSSTTSSSNTLVGPSLLSTRFASVLGDLANPRISPSCFSPLGLASFIGEEGASNRPRRPASQHRRWDLPSLHVYLDYVCDFEWCSLYWYVIKVSIDTLLVYSHLILLGEFPVRCCGDLRNDLRKMLDELMKQKC